MLIRWLISGCLATLLVSPGSSVYGQEEGSKEPRIYLGKALIETPIKSLIDSKPVLDNGKNEGKPLQAGSAPADARKFALEAPVEELIAEKSELNVGAKDFATRNASVLSIKKSGTENENPSCAPGLVVWHPDFDTACLASEMSGKPVMLFQLLGNLDQRFT